MTQDQVQDPPATAEDLLEVGLTYRQVDYWTRMGWLRADNPECGTGRVRRYPRGEVQVAKLMAALVTEGEMSPGKASAAARNGGWLADGMWLAIRRDDLELGDWA